MYTLLPQGVTKSWFHSEENPGLDGCQLENSEQSRDVAKGTNLKPDSSAFATLACHSDATHIGTLIAVAGGNTVQ